MSVTLESVERINALKNGIEATTGKTYNDLTEAVQGLKDGYGQGGGGDDQLVTILDGTATEISNSEVTSLRDNVFSGMSSLKSVDFPSLQTIGDFAFSSCTALELTSLPSGVTSIGSSAFAHCASLALTDLPPNLQTIGSMAFDQCKELAITSIPSTVTAIGQYAFRNCSNLTRMVFQGELYRLDTRLFYYCTGLNVLVLRRTSGPCALANTNVFEGTPFSSSGTGGTVYVPEALIESYQTATNWTKLYAAGTCNFVAIEGSEYE